MQVTANGSSDLRHFERMCKTRAVKIVLAGKEHLCFCLQPAERSRMDDAVAVLLERSPVIVLPFVFAALRIKGVVESIVHIFAIFSARCYITVSNWINYEHIGTSKLSDQ